MASVSAPYGLIPVNKLGGYDGGAMRRIKITSGYGTSIFNGDIVTLASSGTIEATQAATPARPIGVFLGCEYTDADGQWLQRNYWPASTVASDAYALVADDPTQLFRAQADGSLAQTALGNNIQMATYVAGSTANGRAATPLAASTAATTNTFSLKIIDFVDGPDSTVGDAYTDVIVGWNPTLHHYNLALGV